MSKNRDYIIPYVQIYSPCTGWGICPMCSNFTYQEGVQDWWVAEKDGYTFLVPDVYCRCLSCGEKWTSYRFGDYDPLVAVYQAKARGYILKEKQGVDIDA